MKKTLLAALASLMLAGAISAASGLTSPNQPADLVVLMHDGSAPLPTLAASAGNASDITSPNK